MIPKVYRAISGTILSLEILIKAQIVQKIEKKQLKYVKFH